MYIVVDRSKIIDSDWDKMVGMLDVLGIDYIKKDTEYKPNEYRVVGVDGDTIGIIMQPVDENCHVCGEKMVMSNVCINCSGRGQGG